MGVYQQRRNRDRQSGHGEAVTRQQRLLSLCLVAPLLLCKSEFAYELAKRGHSLGLEATLNLDLTFREVTNRDWRVRELISSCSEMLEACPEDTILHGY
jgi:hypothetical protein